MSYVVSKSCLKGEVKISGAKNSALRLLAASLLTNERVVINNFPTTLDDAIIHIDMLRVLGKTVVVSDENKEVVIEESVSLKTELNWDERSIRNTLLILGASLSRNGEGKVPLPGGCKIGDRKFDIHQMVFEELGARVWIDEKNNLCAEAKKGLVGKDIYLPMRSTGATENAILCASLAKGRTTIWNPHIRPEIIDLMNFLEKMGANVVEYNQGKIIIDGVSKLSGVTHEVIPDGVEAITWLIASVITNGDLLIKNFPYKHVEVPLIFLRESGAAFAKGEDGLRVQGGSPFPVEIVTGPYPGINSDFQPLFAVYGMCGQGFTKITDLRFKNRFQYIDEFSKFGLKKIDIVDDSISFNSSGELSGAHVSATDLRGGVAMVLAGLVASGETIVENEIQIKRGYDDFLKKLQSIGGNITER